MYIIVRFKPHVNRINREAAGLTALHRKKSTGEEKAYINTVCFYQGIRLNNTYRA